MIQYYFAIGSQNFLMKEEPVEEILRERRDYYKRINKNIDFWLVTDPTFIHLEKFKKLKTQLSKPHAAIISLDKQFIQWLKLRIGFVAVGSFEYASNITDINEIIYHDYGLQKELKFLD